MNWDQIENNWVAMTRRVRPDLSVSMTRRTVSSQPTVDVSRNDLKRTAADGTERTTEQAPDSPSRQVA